MAALHTALRSLSPTPFFSVPTDDSGTTTYLEQAFRDARTVIDSVPLPAPSDPVSSNRPRSNTTTSNASNISEISSSSARSDLLDPVHEALQKEWGKPVKVNAKDNQLGISVYKLSGKDGKGNWFARRSVHEGLGFKRWKMAMEREFPETLEVQGGPGEGNIRGIGGERRVERKVIDGVGQIEGTLQRYLGDASSFSALIHATVYHLSAQFPGPTTPRDFVTLLLTSSSAMVDSTNPEELVSKSSRFYASPRHYMVISRPCDHSECPPRDGFVRGQYESVEFIRELPSQKPRKSISATDLRKLHVGGESADTMEREAVVRNAMRKSKELPDNLLSPDRTNTSAAGDNIRDGRQRGKTISFAGSRGQSAKGEKVDTAAIDESDDPSNPVEWIMVTRSDPGGGIPRFMVDRGTPSSIIVDAGKFLDWACKKEHPEDITGPQGNDSISDNAHKHDLEAYQTNGHLAGLEEAPEEVLDGSAKGIDQSSETVPIRMEKTATPESTVSQPEATNNLLASVTHAAYAGIEMYGPQALIDRLPSHQSQPSPSADGVDPSSKSGALNDGLRTPTRTSTSSSLSSVGSFMSAEDHFDKPEEDSSSITKPSVFSDQNKTTTKLSQEEKELSKLTARKAALDAKLASTRAKTLGDRSSETDLTDKERAKMEKVIQKHREEMGKLDSKHTRTTAKLMSRKKREEEKEEERRRRAEEKDERSRMLGDMERLRTAAEKAGRERDELRETVGRLQSENTLLVARLGKMEGAEGVLKEIREGVAVGLGTNKGVAALASSDGRTRSSSVRSGKTNGSAGFSLADKILKENMPMNGSATAAPAATVPVSSDPGTRAGDAKS